MAASTRPSTANAVSISARLKPRSLARVSLSAESVLTRHIGDGLHGLEDAVVEGAEPSHPGKAHRDRDLPERRQAGMRRDSAGGDAAVLDAYLALESRIAGDRGLIGPPIGEAAHGDRRPSVRSAS